MNRRIPTLGLLLIALAGPVGCQTLDTISEPEDVRTRGEITEAQQQALEEARRAKEAGDYDAALAMFKEILAENPTIATGYMGIADIHMIKKDFRAAEKNFGVAARLEPRNFDAQYGHGLALHMLQRYSDAVRAFHRALLIDPDDVQANLSLATTYLNMNEARSALLYAEKAVELDPDNGAARTNLGAIYELLGRNREAIDQYRAAQEMMPPSPQLMLNLINVLSREKRYHEVLFAAETLLKLEQSANVYERMGHAHFRLGEYDRSMDAYSAAVELEPDHWQALNGIGVNAINRWLLSKKRDTAAAVQARSAFRRSLRVNQDQPKVVQLLSNYQLR